VMSRREGEEVPATRKDRLGEGCRRTGEASSTSKDRRWLPERWRRPWSWREEREREREERVKGWARVKVRVRVWLIPYWKEKIDCSIDSNDRSTCIYARGWASPTHKAQQAYVHSPWVP
jgi:hypothetical protein